MKVLHIVGARPNFMKAAPVMAALSRAGGVEQTLVHTGQHYDANMSQVFFQQLGLPEPDLNLGVGSGSHAVQTAEVMQRLEPILSESGADWVLVYGDVNSTLAATLVCAKLLIPVAHVEAGLRSGDRTMPEEVNRIVTDHLADLLLTPSVDGNENLVREGVAPERIRFVGNVMIDTLVRLLPAAQALSLPEIPSQYALVTLHRPSNVDDPEILRQIVFALRDVCELLPVVFPVHPRTRQRLETMDLLANRPAGLQVLEPLGYLEFLALQSRAAVVITDSGGIQEETTYLGAPCLTLRENTERPITIEMGTNQLLGRDAARIRPEVERLLSEGRAPSERPPLWDGKASDRIARLLTALGTEARREAIAAEAAASRRITAAAIAGAPL